MNISSIYIKKVPIERYWSLLSRSIKLTLRFSVVFAFRTFKKEAWRFRIVSLVVPVNGPCTLYVEILGTCIVRNFGRSFYEVFTFVVTAFLVMYFLQDSTRMYKSNCFCFWRCERPYQHDSTASRLLSEVKHVRAWLVLRWGTTLES